MAAFLGSAAEGASLLRPLRQLGPELDTFASVPPVVLGDLAMDPLDPVPFQSTSALLDELPPAGDRRHAGDGRPGLRARPDRLDAAAAPDGRRAGPRHARRRRPRHAAGRHQHVRARRRSSTSRCARPSTAALADVDAALQPYRAGYYPNFVEEPADASAFFDPGDLEAPAARSRRPTTPPACSWATTTSQRPAGRDHTPPSGGGDGASSAPSPPRGAGDDFSYETGGSSDGARAVSAAVAKRWGRTPWSCSSSRPSITSSATRRPAAGASVTAECMTAM